MMTLGSVKREIIQSVEFVDDSDRRLLVSCTSQQDYRELIAFMVYSPDLERWFEVSLDRDDVGSLSIRLQKWKSMVDKGPEVPGSIILDGHDHYLEE